MATCQACEPQRVNLFLESIISLCTKNNEIHLEGSLRRCEKNRKCTQDKTQMCLGDEGSVEEEEMVKVKIQEEAPEGDDEGAEEIRRR